MATHGQGIGNLQFWPVRCRSLGVRHHSLLVRRARWTNAGPTLCIRRHSLCAPGIFEHAQMCARSSTHETTRQRDARHARSALDQRQTYAEQHALRVSNTAIFSMLQRTQSLVLS